MTSPSIARYRTRTRRNAGAVRTTDGRWPAVSSNAFRTGPDNPSATTSSTASRSVANFPASSPSIALRPSRVQLE